MSAILEFQDVARSYTRGVPVLDGVSFALEEGEVVGLLGRNGSGKTTLIHIAMGMLVPQRGAVRAFGLSPTQDAVAVKKRIGYVAEDQVLPTNSTIEELINFYRYLFADWDQDLERQILERFRLSRTSKILKLSKGQSRAVALLLAICHRPELLILDEPAAGLDPAARRDFLEVSIQFLNRGGATILYSSHYMNDIERLGSRVVMLDEGRVYLDSEVDRLREDYCLALIPVHSAQNLDALKRTPGYLRARSHFEVWHAVYQGQPEAIRNHLEQSLGTDGIRCERMTLEELFIELMGDKQQ